MAHGRQRVGQVLKKKKRARVGKDGRIELLCELCGAWVTNPYYISPMTHAETGMVLFPEFHVCQECHGQRGHTLRPPRRIVAHEYPLARTFNALWRGSARPELALSGSQRHTGSTWPDWSSDSAT